MKKAIFGGALALIAIALGIVLAPSDAQAGYWDPYNGGNPNFPGLGGCPSVNVYYTNGFSSSYCVPSYTPGYPTYPTQPVFSTNYDPYNPGYTPGAPSVIYHPPHPFGPWQYNQPFYPYNPTPTYYYPSSNYGWGGHW